MAVPLLDLSRQHDALKPQFSEVFEGVLDTGGFILGPYVERFEADLARYVKATHALGVSSGTDALLVALMALGVGPGDEVITTPFTFFSTAGSIARLGAKPVFVDINPQTYNLQVESIEGAITERTKAIVPVHLFGLPADMNRILKIAEAYRLYVVEDAAQAIGASIDGRPVGSIGHVGTWSFYPTKNLSAMGDAGAVTTHDGELAARMAMLRNHGLESDYTFRRIGGNFRLDGIQAGVLRVKLQHIEQYNEARRRHAAYYDTEFERLPLGTPFEVPSRRHVYHQYTVRVHGGANQRQALQEHLAACGIGTRVYYEKPLHLQPCFEHLGYRRGSLPEAERAADEVLSLPVFPEMTRPEQDEVIEAVVEFFQSD
mgnify:CR=1 FL=1